jgi:hypothetical protein
MTSAGLDRPIIDYVCWLVGSSTCQLYNRRTRAWQAIGARYATINTLNAELASPQEHIDALCRFQEAL